MKKIRILTNIDANHGSCIFNVTLNNLLKENLNRHEVKFLDAIPFSMRMYEVLKFFKFNKTVPLYNYYRYTKLMKYSKNSLSVDSHHRLFSSYNSWIKKLHSCEYDALIVAKVIWNINDEWESPNFPNVFWLSEKIPSVKIAYAVSGYRTNLDLYNKYLKDIRRLLMSYSLIGVRDDMTQEMLDLSGVSKYVNVHRVSDPAVMYNKKDINKKELANKYNIDLNRPVLGLLYHGNEFISKYICSYYGGKGYQIINFNMYNSNADINIGHLVDPDEWAAIYQLLSFCITDRFHSSIFCILNDIPFVAIEPHKPITLLNSKIFSLLSDFNIVEPCYHNQFKEGFDINLFIETCEFIETYWAKKYSTIVQQNLVRQKNIHNNFIHTVSKCIESSG